MSAERKIRRIVFLESIADAQSWLKDNCPEKLHAQDTLLIAMSPAVRAYLGGRNLPAENTLSYFGNEARLKAMRQSQVLVDWLEQRASFSNPEIGVRDAYKNWFLFLMRFAVNYCLWSIEIILSALDRHQPEVLTASCSGKKETASVYLEPEEKALGYLVRAAAGMRGLAFEDIDTKGSIGRPVCTKVILKYLFARAKFSLWEGWIFCRKLFALKKRPVFFTSPLYQMDGLAQRLQAELENRPVFFLKGPVISSLHLPDWLIGLFWRNYAGTIKIQQQAFDELRDVLQRELKLFSCEGISFAEIIAQKIKSNIAPYIIGQFLWSFELKRSLDILKPSVILSSGSRPDDALLAELCREKSIPSIFVSHGSYVPPKNEFEQIEWGEHGRIFLRAPFMFHALQSPLGQGYLRAFSSSSRIVKAGPLIWGRGLNPLRRAKRIILHAGTSKESNVLRFHIYEGPDEYIQALCDLAQAVEKTDDTQLVIRFRPISQISVEDLKALVPFSQKVILSTEGPFKNLLEVAGLLVSFSSTTIEEALQNRIPVLLYGGRGRYQHVPAYSIEQGRCPERSAVYHAQTAEDLQYAVREIPALNISGDKDAGLFAPYIYSEKTRTSLAELIKGL